MGEELRAIANEEGWTNDTLLSVLITVLENSLRRDQQDAIVDYVEEIANG